MSDLPEFITIGADDHPLGKRSCWLYPDGRLEVLAEAYGLTETFTYPPEEGRLVLDTIRKTYKAHDDTGGFG